VTALTDRVLESRFLRFLVVGGFGFLVDAGVLWLMIHGAGANKYEGRIVSFLCAATFTWWGNRNLTFADSRARGSAGAVAGEWLRFLAANAIGGAINVGLYAVLVTYGPETDLFLLFALACGVLAGLVFNFKTSKLLVFKR